MKNLVELHEKHGVKVSTLVNNFHDDNEKALRKKDFHNFHQKLNQTFKESKDEKLEKLLDELKENPNTLLKQKKIFEAYSKDFK
jgi:uncharacterized protein YeaO (DUF488 family)